MIKIVPHFMKVRNGDGKFVDYLVIKGAPGDIENLSYFTTSETGDSEELVMTQKGVTDIHDKLLSGEMMVGSADYSNFAVYAERAANDADGIPFAATYATLSKVDGTLISEGLLDKALSLGEGVHQYHLRIDYSSDDIPAHQCRHASATIYKKNSENICVVIWGTEYTPVCYNVYDSGAHGWHGWRSIIDSSNIASQSVNHAGTATKADTATKAESVDGAEATAQVYRWVWFSQDGNKGKRAYNDKFRYDPKSNTLQVGNITGNAATATKADTATKAERVNGEAATAQAFRHVWFSDSGIEAKRVYDDEFKYDPKSHTLTVGSITGNAATATKADTATTATTADKLKSDSFKTATATCQVSLGLSDTTVLPSANVYLVTFSVPSDNTTHSGMLHLQASGKYYMSLGKYLVYINFQAANNGGCEGYAKVFDHQVNEVEVTGTLKFYRISS